MTASTNHRARPYVVRPVALGGVPPGVNLDKALALADGIEDQELAARIQPRDPAIG